MDRISKEGSRDGTPILDKKADVEDPVGGRIGERDGTVSIGFTELWATFILSCIRLVPLLARV